MNALFELKQFHFALVYFCSFLIFEFFIPALLVIILCLCIGPIPFDLDLAVVNKDTSDLSVKFLKLVNNRTIVQVSTMFVALIKIN